MIFAKIILGCYNKFYIWSILSLKDTFVWGPQVLILGNKSMKTGWYSREWRETGIPAHPWNSNPLNASTPGHICPLPQINPKVFFFFLENNHMVERQLSFKR